MDKQKKVDMINIKFNEESVICPYCNKDYKWDFEMKHQKENVKLLTCIAEKGCGKKFIVRYEASADIEIKTYQL